MESYSHLDLLMNKRKLLVCLGFTVVTGFILSKKCKSMEGKVRQAEIVIKNELPLKLEFIQDDLNHMKKLKKIRISSKENLRKVLKIKFDWVKQFIEDTCYYFKIDFNTFSNQSSLACSTYTLSTVPCRDSAITFDWNKKFNVNEYINFLLEYLNILERFTHSRDYEELIINENVLFSRVSQEYHINESSLLGAHLKFHNNCKVHSLISRIKFLQSSIPDFSIQ